MNSDGLINNTDIQYLTNFFFANGSAPARACLSDVDANGSSDVRDVFYLINFLYGAGPQPAQVSEVCNGIDDDCDGVIDNGAAASCPAADPTCQTGPACIDGACSYTNINPGNLTCGLGICQRTVPLCVDGHLNPCVPGSSQQETCNDLDDDCDGQIDNGAVATCTAGDPGCQTAACTNGACVYMNRDAVAGTTTCGQGVCRVTQNNCIGGHPHTCTPNSGAASTETCNGLDDNCDGTIDNGNFSDANKPNNSCSQPWTLAQVGSNNGVDNTHTYNSETLYPSGDADYFHVQATETDSICACCDLFCTVERYRFSVTLTVPSGAGTYEVCYSQTCGGTDRCFTVPAGTTSNAGTYLLLNGTCISSDSYDLYISVRGFAGTGFSCAPYTLSYNFQSDVCN